MSLRGPKIHLASGRDLHFPTEIRSVAFHRSCIVNASSVIEEFSKFSKVY